MFPGFMLILGMNFGIMPALSQQPFSYGLFPAKTIAYQAVPSDVPKEKPKFPRVDKLPPVKNKLVTNSKLPEEKLSQNKKS